MGLSDIGTGGTGTTTEVEITSPVSISGSISVDQLNNPLQTVSYIYTKETKNGGKFSSRDAFMLDMAAKLYCNMNHSDSISAKDNAEKAMNYAKIFWNVAQSWYADELISDGTKDRYRFSGADKPN